MIRIATLAVILLPITQSLVVNISNTEPRKDVNGNLMDCHDGQIVQWQPGGPYYWYGMGYQNCTETTGIIPPFNCPGIYQHFGECGFREDHAVNVYSSPNLVDWSFEVNALPVQGRPLGIYFRPKIIYNQQNDEYLLWVNYLPPASTPLAGYTNATYIVAASKSPTGPFAIVTQRASVAVSGGGDFTLMVDTEDAQRSAYIAYDAWDNNHRIVIEKLTADYRDSMGGAMNTSTGPVSETGNEAPILFLRNGWYYLFFGPTCCFCSSGSGSLVYTAKHPLGPWANSNNPPDLNPKGFPVFGGRTIKAQENYVFQVQQANTTAMTYVYTGDLWASAPDKLKSHDLQYWEPLVFDDLQSPPTISKLTFLSSFELDLP